MAWEVERRFDDEEDEGIAENWDDEDEEGEAEGKEQAGEPKEAKKQHSTLKQKIAQREQQKEEEKQRESEMHKLREEVEEETPGEKRARLKKLELEADIKNIDELFGGGETRTRPEVKRKGDESQGVESILEDLKLEGKEDSDRLLQSIVPLLASHTSAPHYSLFLQDLFKALASPMSSEQIRKLSSALSALSNEKQREEKGGGKGAKKKAKPALGARVSQAADTTEYSEALDDDVDFM